MNCPAKCIQWDGKELNIDNRSCRHCMHCINVMSKALRPGTDTGAVVLIGSKVPIVEGALLSSVLIPFWKPEPPYKDLKDLVERIQDVWCEEGKNRERIGEFIQRVGMGNFLDAVEVEPIAEMVAYPRDNPYVFYEEYYEPKQRYENVVLPVEKRYENPDAEIVSTLTKEEIIDEAVRCMSCGYCFDCGTCWSYCQDSAIVKPLEPGAGYKFKLDLCTGCDKCGKNCPCGYIEMR